MKVQVYRAALRRAGVLVVSDVATDNATAAARVLHAFLCDAPAERVVVLYLNSQNAIIGAELVAMGGGSQCAVSPSEVFRGAIVAGATAIVVGHNHPSGDPTPSNDDLLMTRGIIEAGRTLGIVVLDHIVVTRSASNWVSIRDRIPGLFE
jgi:DNA repair protein RadC